MSASDSSSRPAPGPQLPTYGPSITLAQAKQVAEAALRPARDHGWTVVVAICDPGGHLVYLEKLDDTQVGSVLIAEEKARSSAIFKRPTKMFQERLARGGDGLLVLRLAGVVPVEGGVPIVVDGKLIGALGVSGGSSAEDEACAVAGLTALT
jgi:glc operon protein GlcG